VTKTVDPFRIQEALDAGVHVLGENRVQEARDKMQRIGGGAQWHLIGHLQRNKVRQAVALFEMIHSVDSVRLAEALDGESRRQGKVMPVLLQVNVSGEASKFGVGEAEVPGLVRALAGMENLSLQGLMTIPPYSEHPEDARPDYRRLRELRDGLAELGLPGMELPHLSMGMTQDFEVAVEEGATMVRIGTALFGTRC
jgi:hypothetical protein